MSIWDNPRFRKTGQQIVDNILAVRERGEAIDNEMLERAIDWMTVAITSASADDRKRRARSREHACRDAIEARIARLEEEGRQKT